MEGGKEICKGNREDIGRAVGGELRACGSLERKEESLKSRDVLSAPHAARLKINCRTLSMRSDNK